MMTNITTKIIAILSAVLLFTSTNIEAQHNASDTLRMRKQRCDTMMKYAAYILEGKLISTKTFRGSDGRYYNSNIIDIQEVISGNIQKGTIELITIPDSWKDENGNEVRGSEHSHIVFKGDALYFCKDAETGAKNSGVSNVNSKTLRVWDATAFSGDKITQRGTYSVFRYFTTISQFYTYLNSNYGIKIDNTLLEKKSPVTPTTKNKAYKTYAKWKQDIANRKHSSNNTSRAVGCTELYISEYLCGQGNNKSIEVYNPTSSSINLSGYSILIYHGASYTPTTIALTGTISALSTHVISKPNASAAILAHTNQTSNNLNFNGDEIIVLNKATIHIDKIGVIGTAIGSGGWTLTPTGSTVNADLRRNYNISIGDTSWTNCKTEWTPFSKDSINDIGKHSNICGVDPDLNLTLSNPQVVGSNFQFDIMVSSVGDTYLDSTMINLTYNSIAFGSHAVASGGVSVTLGTAFNTSYYINPQTTLIDGQDSIGIFFSPDPTQPFNATYITGTSVVLMTINIAIQNCNDSANIAFTNLAATRSSSFYPSDTNITALINYTNVNFSGGLYTLIPPCVPINITIKDFPSPVIAGIGQTMTIIGSGFGASQGNGQVQFTNADDGGARYIQGLNASDYILWNDSTIQITLPSWADGFTSPDTLFTIGGNDFIVQNNSGSVRSSGVNLSGNSFTIFFNLMQNRNTLTSNKNRINLIQTDTSGGYVFRLNPTDIPVGSGTRICFAKAVQDWRCITGANLSIGKDTIITGNPIAQDGVNYVYTAAEPVFLAETYRHPNSCNLDIGSLSEADIEFSTSFFEEADTTRFLNMSFSDYDFYEICTHELGHVVGLEHNVIPTDLMYYQETGGNSVATRKHLVPGSASAQGGIYSVNHSISTVSSLPCWTAMVIGSCSKPAGIEQYLNNSTQLLLYPNPSNNNITIETTISSQLGTVVMYNMLGEVVYSQTSKETITQIDVSQQVAGVYLIKVQNQIIKLIKQ